MGNLPESVKVGTDMITSTSNAQIKKIIQLNTKGKARRNSRAFVVEGVKMFLEAPLDWIEEVYLAESFLEKYQGSKKEEYNQELLEKLERTGYETVSDQVFRHASDTMTPQGILCIVKMPEYRREDLSGGSEQKKVPLLLVTENVQDPGNLGTMFRTAEGAGVTGILMSRDTVDIFNPKTIRSTMGSIYRMPFLYTEDLKKDISELQKEGVHFYAAHLKGKASYDEADYQKPSAFLIGNEGNGLTTEIADLADIYIRIPMEGKLESLNAAMAAGILMYEANRQRRT